MRKIIYMMILMIFLPGCAEMNSKFDCPIKSGVRCMSLSQVDAKISQGKISHSAADESNNNRNHFNTNELTYPSSQKNIVSTKQGVLKTPYRSHETVQHIWVAPFEDIAGNYHEENHIYTVTKPGHWINDPVKEINDTEE